jgi:hypothetical protein
MKLNILFLAFALLILSACEKTIDLDIQQTPQKVVIEGLLTDNADYNYVKVSRTNGFYSTGLTPRIQDAAVSVEDDLGNIHDFIHYNGTSEDSLGYYFPAIPFAGEVGRTYKLTVVTDGKVYEAEDELLRLVPMDKIEYRVNEDEKEDPEFAGRFYELLLFVTEPKDTKDYYLFKSVRNGKVEYMNETDIYFSDDELLGEEIEGVALPVFYAVNDVAGVEVYSLTRDGFIFYRDLQKLLNNDGGLFGTPPANPRTNISNDGLGFFQVSSIKTAELIIQE